MSLTTETNVAALIESSPFRRLFVLLKLLVLIAGLTNSCFVSLIGVDVASSSALAVIAQTTTIFNKMIFFSQHLFG